MPLIPENLGASTIVIKLKLSLYKLENTSNQITVTIFVAPMLSDWHCGPFLASQYQGLSSNFQCT